MDQNRIAEIEKLAQVSRSDCPRGESDEADALEQCVDEVRRLQAYSDRAYENLNRFEAEVLRLNGLHDAMAITLSSMAHEINAATNWWASKLMRVARFDNGDRSAVGGMTAVLAMMVSAKNAVPTEAEIARFKASLHQRLRLRCVATWRYDMPEWGSYQRCVAVDYGPDRILAAACADAGIDNADSRFPCKTSMWIDPGKVSVSEGYRAEPVTIFPVATVTVVDMPEPDGFAEDA